MKEFDERPVMIRSGNLQLEGMLHGGRHPVAALVLHPHPQYGGDMHNHVVMALVEALGARGASTLRFNFRGAGLSQGAFDGGAGERDDAIAAASALREACPDGRFVLAGYSFGAMIAAGSASKVAPDALVLVSPPLGFSPLERLPEGVPVLAITGDRDPISPANAVRSLEGLDITAVVVPGVDHAWWPGVERLVDDVDVFGKTLTPPLFDA